MSTYLDYYIKTWIAYTVQEQSWINESKTDCTFVLFSQLVKSVDGEAKLFYLFGFLLKNMTYLPNWRNWLLSSLFEG